MKKLLLILFVSAVAFAQGRGRGHEQQTPQHQVPQQQHWSPPASNWQRFGQPEWHRPPVVVRRPIVERPVYVHPYIRFGMYDWNFYYGWGYWPYYPWFYGSNGEVVYQNNPQPCKKEKLKDSQGKKHEVLICLQPDGTTKVVADADSLVRANR